MTLLGHLAAEDAARGAGEFDARPLVIYPPRADLAKRLESSGVVLEPLPSSKGAGTEMIYSIQRDRLTPAVRRRLFAWGLDCA